VFANLLLSGGLLGCFTVHVRNFICTLRWNVLPPYSRRMDVFQLDVKETGRWNFVDHSIRQSGINNLKSYQSLYCPHGPSLVSMKMPVEDSSETSEET